MSRTAAQRSCSATSVASLMAACHDRSGELRAARRTMRKRQRRLSRAVLGTYGSCRRFCYIYYTMLTLPMLLFLQIMTVLLGFL